MVNSERGMFPYICVMPNICPYMDWSLLYKLGPKEGRWMLGKEIVEYAS